MPRGGARPNSGPKPNSVILRTREAAIDACNRAGVTPIEVMAFNLKFWYESAVNMTSRIEELLDQVPTVEGEDRLEIIRNINNNLKNMLIARDKAQEVAADMAPYRHPRLSSIEVTDRFLEEGVEKSVPMITHKTEPKDAVRRYEDLLAQGV